MAISCFQPIREVFCELTSPLLRRGLFGTRLSALSGGFLFFSHLGTLEPGSPSKFDALLWRQATARLEAQVVQQRQLRKISRRDRSTRQGCCLAVDRAILSRSRQALARTGCWPAALWSLRRQTAGAISRSARDSVSMLRVPTKSGSRVLRDVRGAPRGSLSFGTTAASTGCCSASKRRLRRSNPCKAPATSGFSTGFWP